MATTENPPAYILSSRKTSSESERLNDQHAFISSIGPPELLHPLIPRENVLRVADVATGTGIWLEDLASAIEQTPTTEGQARQYDGFDISDTFFPQNHGPNSRYVIQDILKPFPSEYHGIYDLVHVKHLIVALKSTDLPTALQNLVQILAPGGYLQWEEFDVSSIELLRGTPEAQKILEDASNLFSKAHGFATDFSELLPPAFQRAGLEDTTQSEYRSLRPETREKSAEAARVWHLGSCESIVHVLYAKDEDGKVRDAGELEQVIGEKMDDIKEFHRGGGIPGLWFVVTLGRK